MRALVLMVALTACATTVPPTDGMPDSDNGDLCAPQPGLFSRAQCEHTYGADVCDEMCVQVGRSCSTEETPFCAGGFAWCAGGTCRDFCRDSPCANGTHRESVTAEDGRRICVCSA